MPDGFGSWYGWLELAQHRACAGPPRTCTPACHPCRSTRHAASRGLPRLAQPGCDEEVRRCEQSWKGLWVANGCMPPPCAAPEPRELGSTMSEPEQVLLPRRTPSAQVWAAGKGGGAAADVRPGAEGGVGGELSQHAAPPPSPLLRWLHWQCVLQCVATRQHLCAHSLLGSSLPALPSPVPSPRWPPRSTSRAWWCTRWGTPCPGTSTAAPSSTTCPTTASRWGTLWVSAGSQPCVQVQPTVAA